MNRRAFLRGLLATSAIAPFAARLEPALAYVTAKNLPLESFTVGDVVGIAIDVPRQLVWSRINRSPWNGAAPLINETTGGAGDGDHHLALSVLPMCCFKVINPIADGDGRFGHRRGLPTARR